MTCRQAGQQNVCHQLTDVPMYFRVHLPVKTGLGVEQHVSVQLPAGPGHQALRAHQVTPAARLRLDPACVSVCLSVCTCAVSIILCFDIMSRQHAIA